MQGELFPRERHAPEVDLNSPLAARMRPQSLDQIAGQEHLTGKDSMLARAIAAGKLPSLILWGPPGTGKTTLALILAQQTRASFCPISAVAAGVADLRRIIEDARKLRNASGKGTVLFIDEIHRFNKAQQDVILPHVESGLVTLIGATTENPSFEVNAALLSRCRVCTLHPLTEESIKQIVARALEDEERGLGQRKVSLEPETMEALATLCDGDARVALNALELAVAATPAGEGGRSVNVAAIQEALQRKNLLYDKGGDQHYDIISALHKSMRDSDPDASLYWLARMLEAGEDPLFVARRVVRAASEDVGLADPQALTVAMAAQQAVHFIGMPEGNLALAEAVLYIALAPKSNALYKAYGEVKNDLENTRAEPVPLQIRNAVTKLMKDSGYGKGYRYVHSHIDETSASGEGMRRKLNENLPPSLKGRRYYNPLGLGFEKELKRRLEQWREG